MKDVDDTGNYSSDDDINPLAHKKLLDAVSRIGKTQYIKKPSRSEPALAQDEFHLAKGVAEDVEKVHDSAVFVSDLVQVLNKTSKHFDIGKELKNTKRNKKVLPKPLERPVAERIRRQIGYESLKNQLSKWDAVVTRNRAAEQQIFPLEIEEIKVNIKETKPPEFCIKSDLMKKFEEIEAEYRSKPEETKATADEENKLQETLTKEELIARRKKLAYMRIKESQKSARARLQNKIKSKKYHKLLKRQKIKEQMQEFESLQKINPEAALDKLKEIEKNRVLERASLRHKNTGTWAKNLQVRAKYDKDVQKDLAEQLALSRELTSKLKQEDEESGEEPEEDSGEEGQVDPFNPWMKRKQKSEVAEFESGYRKYWMQRNKNDKEMKEFKNGDDNNRQEKEVNDYPHVHELPLKLNDADLEDGNSDPQNELKGKEENSSYRKPMQSALGETKTKAKTPNVKKTEKRKPKTKGTAKAKPVIKQIAGGWVVEGDDDHSSSEGESAAPTKDIHEIFDEAEDIVENKINKKFQKLSQSFQNKQNKRPFDPATSTNKHHLDLSFKKKATRPEFDEELLEIATRANEASDTTSKVLNDIQKAVSAPVNSEDPPDKRVQAIDPKSFVTIKAKTFKNELADIINSGDFLDDDDEDDDAINQQLTLSAAFEDDDIEADFQKERDEERKKNSNEEVDLTLPGWGSWAGCGISLKKRNRLVLKFPQEEKRRDDNKEKVFINENENKKLKSHLVSELPFPFTCVKDYEASIRAPIGPDFVPETAFKVLTRPAVITKMGHIIEPMKQDQLLKGPKRPRHFVDKKIAKLSKVNGNKKRKR